MSQRLSPQNSLSTEAGQTDRLTNGPDVLILQGDGNLVLLHSDVVRWASNTDGRGGNRLVMQDDGNLVLYAGESPVWASNTDGNNGAYLEIQDDGNLVIYMTESQVLWATNTTHPVVTPAADTTTTPEPAAPPAPPAQDATPAPAPEPPAPQAPPAPPPPRTYTVQPGDSLSAIAAQNGYDNWQGIYDANRDTIGGDPNDIQPGMVLTLP